MLQKLKQRNEGFTIIEVLIVLAIAGLILLVVFLAVPALQRNSRNTARKNDAASILGAMTEFTNNNNGAFPASCAAGTGTGQCGAAGTFLSNAKLGTIDPAQVLFTKNTAAVTTATAAPTLDAAKIISFDKCASATADAGSNPSSRSFVILYLVETGGGTQLQCVESGS